MDETLSLMGSLALPRVHWLCAQAGWRGLGSLGLLLAASCVFTVLMSLEDIEGLPFSE